METYYEKDVKEQLIKQYQPEASTPLAYKSESVLKDKEAVFKDIYSSIKLFDRLIYEVKQELQSEKLNKIPVR